MINALDLSPEQQNVLTAIENGYNVFVTGSAGTGKSYLLRYLKGAYLGKGLHLTASTGIAAVNIGGVTLHSWAGIGLGVTPVTELAAQMLTPRFSRLRKKLCMAKMLAIDEISMISADTFDLVNQLLKIVRDNSKPFGGLQLILFGDFLQLPPVITESSQGPTFCFESTAWNEAGLKVFLLQKIFRQNDDLFIKILNNLRFGSSTQEDFLILKQRYEAKDTDPIFRPTIITTHTQQANSVNQTYLEALKTPEQQFKAYFLGDDKKYDFLRKNCLAPEMLTLKIGTQVMMLKNTFQKDGVINGSIGIIKGFSERKNYPIVEFNNGKLLTIGYEEWNIERFDEQKRTIVVDATMVQVPLIPSWAITVHKSQGMTLDKIECDLFDAFAEGQVYVALSRARSLNGLFIKSFNANKVIVNPKVVAYYQQLLHTTQKRTTYSEQERKNREIDEQW